MRRIRHPRALLTVLALTVLSTSSLHGQAVCPAPGEVSLTRPTVNGEPTQVKVSIYVNDVASINDVHQTFTADIFVLAAWSDPRVAEPGVPTERVKCSDMERAAWRPTLEIANGRDLSRNTSETGIAASGELFHLRRFFGEFSNPLDLRQFPFDSHELVISVMAVHKEQDVVLSPGDFLVGMAEELTLSGWGVTPGTIEAFAQRPPGAQETVYYVQYGFGADRDTTFFVWKLFLPLTLIVFMSWVVFYFDPAALPPQISVAVTSMLTLIAYQFALGQLLPRISYLTVADHFTLASSILIFVALVEVVVVNYLARSDRLDRALTIQRTARWLFPTVYVLICVVVFVL